MEDIYEFLGTKLGVCREVLSPNTDLFHDLHVEGDDFFELEEAFGEHFNVDMSSYRWYFHHNEEGWSPGGLFFKAPQDCVPSMPVTPALLLESANNGRWMLAYPEHSIPAKRYDLTLNLILTILTFLLIIIMIMRWIT